MKSKNTPGLTNHHPKSFQTFFLLPPYHSLPKVLKKNLPAAPFMLLKMHHLGIIMHCNIDLVKNYVFSVIEFGRGNKKKIEGERIKEFELYTPMYLH